MDQYKVLFVDENKVIQQVARLLLSGPNFDVHTVDSGAEATAAFEAQRYHLVFIDCQMSEIEVNDTCRTIKQIQASKGIIVPIIAMAGNATGSSRDKCLAAGMDGWIAKPIDPGELQKVVRHWLNLDNGGNCEASTALTKDVIPEASTALTLDYELLQSRFRKESIKELLSLFVETAPVDVDEIGRSLAMQTYSEASKMVHTFKGSCSMVFAEALVQTCQQLESASGKSDTQQCHTLFAQLNSRLKSTLGEIHERLSALQ